MLYRVTQLSANTKIKRIRLLPSDGHVKILGGQEVKATDVIAETDSHRKHVLLNVRESIDIDRSEDIGQYIHRKELEWIEKGDLIAEKGGLFKRVLRSPVKGKIISINNGRVLIEVHCPPIKLLAGLDGRVVEIFPDRGAAIETSGALLQCAWGNNPIGSGVLICPQIDIQTEFKPDHLDANVDGAIIAINTISTIESINVINQYNPKGLIIGSISSRLYPIIRSQKYPVVLLEGFGNTPINDIAIDILKRNEKRSICINAQLSSKDLSIRPEIVIPSDDLSSSELPLPVDFSPGQVVRIHNMPVVRNLGTIDKLYTEKIKFSNGLFANAASVLLDSSRTINCPLSNLEILVS